MNVKELMAEVDVTRVIDAFLLMDFSFSANNYENTFLERYDALLNLKKVIADNVHLFAECKPNTDTQPCTIFIFYNLDGDDYENQEKKSFGSFAVYDEDVFPILDKDFHIFDDKGEARLSYYSFDTASMNEMANYTIAKSSIEQFGKEVCAAYILSEIFFWGLYPEDREKKVHALEEKVQKSMDEQKLLTEKEVHEMLDDDFDMSDDEKFYYEEKEKFEKKTKFITNRYIAKINDEIQQEYIHAVREEYSSRSKCHN